MHRLIRIALLALVAVGACGGASVRPGTAAAPNIRRVDFRGNRTIDGDTLRGGMGSRRGTPYEPSQVELDGRGIVAFYRQHGHFAARITGVEVRRARPGLVDVIVSIDEGAPTRVGDVTVTGAEDPAGAAKALGLRRGAIFRHAEYLRGKARIRARVAATGHRHAEVRGAVEVDPVTRTAAVRVEVDPGPRVRFGTLRVEGTRLVPPSSVAGRVAWDEGDVFDETLVELTRDRLYALGRFTAVRIKPSVEGRMPVADMVVQVSEGTRHEFRGGFGVAGDSGQWEGRLLGGYTHQGFVFPMTTVRLDGKLAYTLFLDGRDLDWSGLGGEGRVTTEHEDFLVAMLRLTTGGDYSAENFEAYSVHGVRARLGLRRPFLRDRVTLSVGWELRFLQDFYEVSDAISEEERVALGLDGRPVGRFEQTLTWDLRDHPRNTRKGALFELHVEEGSALAGGAFDYLKLTPEASGYVPLGDRVTFAARARLGWGIADDAIPITQRYFSGGSSSQRGFALRHLSPFASGNAEEAPIGGEGLFETGVETRLDGIDLWFLPTFGLAVFLDGADVTLDPTDLDPGNLHWATGIEVRLPTPIGPVRGGVGLRLNRRGDGEPDEGSIGVAYVGLGDAY